MFLKHGFLIGDQKEITKVDFLIKYSIASKYLRKINQNKKNSHKITKIAQKL